MNTMKAEEVDLKSLNIETNTFKINETCQAVYGLINLVNNSYFIIVKKSVKVATIFKKEIFQAKEFKFLKIPN